MKFFEERTKSSPKIYGYTEPNPGYKGLIKVGFTTRPVSERMKEHYPTKGPEGIEKYKVLYEESSMRDDGSFFKDYEVHKKLESAGIERCGSNNEWFRCSVAQLKAAVIAVKDNKSMNIERIKNFSMRPEQKKAVKETKNYFKNIKQLERKIPHFLWNCKMRFGKTFTAYKLAQEMNWSKVLILSFKTAVTDSWKNNLMTHKDFESWEFINGKTESIKDIEDGKPFACFASFQDFLGKSKSGGIKLKNEWAHNIEWDCIILDEYHYGAWNENSKGILTSDEKIIEQEEKGIEKEEGYKDYQNIWNEEISPLNTKHYLYLSGTPFRAIQSGEFIEEQIFNWTYSDEQEAKEEWSGDDNPYESMPRMVMLTYQMPEGITQITDDGEFDQFNLNEFFKADGEGNEAVFKHENYVQQWLDLIRGYGLKNTYASLKLGSQKQFFPFQEVSIRKLINHTFWFLPSVASCYAMKNLMMQRGNSFYQEYEIIVCAGTQAGIGPAALGPVRRGMKDPLTSKSITLSCGKLNTGVTVRPWTGVFMLRNLSAPETYFQTAFRAQSSWTVDVENKPNKLEILKKECYVFDFAPNRALKLISDFSVNLDLKENSHEEKVAEFIRFLPVLCFDGSSMKRINAEEIIDYGMVGTSGSQLAKKFESARLVHVDDITLKRLMANKEALDTLMKIEGFRNLNSDLEKIINQSNNINDLKKESTEIDLTPKKRKELSEEEKKQKSLRKKIQEKLQKFASRIPVFMYLTDYREETLKDVITQLEPRLFKRVTSLSVSDFELLLSLGLFNSTLMNSAIFSFKRYENASLHYDGFTKHNPKHIGLFDTKVPPEEF
tara:strand:- start:92 stop:2590 length:2499 start_codon:yes stop_codon:yes gene_type:complete